MMKKFLTSMLGSIAGFWISIFVLGITFFIFLLVFSNNDNSPLITDKTVLHICLNNDIYEREVPISSIYDIQSYNADAVYFNDIIKAISTAKKDENIRGIFIECKGSTLGTASRQEILNALVDFKASGKWVYSYADNYTQGDYYIASVSDSIFLNPIGQLDIHGLSATTMFYKGLFDKIGIEPQILKVGTYKSAVEPFILTEMSDASREQQMHYLSNIWETVCNDISKYRNVSNENINMWADSLIATQSPTYYKDCKLIDKFYYYNDVKLMLHHKLDLDEDENINLITPKQYCQLAGINSTGVNNEHIAILYATGDIVDSGEGGIVGDVIAPQILELAKDKNVKGLVLRVNSGGGSAFASEQIWNALEQFKQTGKPFYVSMGDIAASGGYYISCGANKIYAEPTTLTGSIGIFGIIINTQKLINEQLGITTDNVSTNLNGDFPSMVVPMTPEQKNKMQQYIERGYETFVNRCAQGRGLDVDSIKLIAEGRVWDGKTAKEIGLIDEFGGLQTTVDKMRQKTGIEDVIEYPIYETSLLNELITSSAKDAQILNSDFTEINKCLKLASRVKRMSQVQCKMEDIIIN